MSTGTPAAARSYLFVPGNRPDRFAKAFASGADAVIIDLEDAVAPGQKEAARLALAAWCAGANDRHAELVVRINDDASPWFEADLALLRTLGPVTVMLPKAESGRQLERVAAALAPGARLLALIESAAGLLEAEAIARVAAVERLAFGTLDYALDLGLGDDPRGLLYPASRIAIASRAAGLASPVAGVTAAIDDEAALRADFALARSCGFGAKMCIHPRQVPTVHAMLAPTLEQLDWARRVLAAAQSGAGAVQVDGKMVDRPVLLRASAVLGQAPAAPAIPTNRPIRRYIMPASIVDSTIFGNIFSTAAMRQIWSDENRTRKYLDIEAALARVQGRLGIIPEEAAEEIIRNCVLEKIDMAKLAEQTQRIGYPVLGVVSQINALCRDKLGEYVHWGATTQDITDTATVLQMREALELVEGELAAISAAMADLAARHRDTPMIGRSNLQQAVPITFGYKVAGLLSAIERHRERLAQLRPRVLVGEFAGASGTLASLGDGGLATQAGLMQELGLGQPDIAWHTIRDNIAEVGCFLGMVTGTLGKFSTDVKLMMQTEVGEVYEPFAHGRGSSSTMPQKRNPISSCYIHACISVVRQHVAALLDANVADHERSTGPWEIEWIVLPEIFCLAAGALAQSRFVLEGLEVDEGRMRANLDLTNGLVVSEAVMMGLGPYLGREYAHDLVYDICRVAIKENRPLLDLLAENAEISQHLDRPALAALCDPASYLGLSGEMVDRVLRSRSQRAHPG